MFRLSVLRAVSILVLLLALSCCSGSAGRPVAGGSAGGRFSAALAELKAAPCPAGIDSGTFELLRAELAAVLEARQAAAEAQPRSASYTPFTPQNQVRDLLVGGSGPHYLVWTYVNQGDYDLNGEVNIADLTPVGLHFGLNSSHPLWLLAQAADGDGNGEVNIADVTPIGVNYGGAVRGYRVWATTGLADSWQQVDDVPFANVRRNPGRPRFVQPIADPAFTHYSLWTYDNSEYEGGWSNTAVVGANAGRRLDGLFDY